MWWMRQAWRGTHGSRRCAKIHDHDATEIRVRRPTEGSQTHWTRQQAIDFLARNTALSIHECTTETDRYISWPGQALSYKIGEITIRDLRRKAEQALGPRFDIRRFHDVVLAPGSVPMPVLDQIIGDFIAAEGR